MPTVARHWLREYTRPSMLLAYGIFAAAAVVANLESLPGEYNPLSEPRTAQDYLDRCHKLPQTHEKAIADCTQAIQRDPSLAGAYEQRGWLYNRVGKSTQAIADYQQAQNLYRNQGDARDLRRVEKILNTIATKGI